MSIQPGSKWTYSNGSPSSRAENVLRSFSSTSMATPHLIPLWLPWRAQEFCLKLGGKLYLALEPGLTKLSADACLRVARGICSSLVGSLAVHVSAPAPTCPASRVNSTFWNSPPRKLNFFAKSDVTFVLAFAMIIWRSKFTTKSRRSFKKDNPFKSSMCAMGSSISSVGGVFEAVRFLARKIDSANAARCPVFTLANVRFP